MIEREYLWEIQRNCERDITPGMNPSWVRAYEALAQAANVLDAFIARSSVPGTVALGTHGADAGIDILPAAQQ